MSFQLPWCGQKSTSSKPFKHHLHVVKRLSLIGGNAALQEVINGAKFLAILAN